METLLGPVSRQRGIRHPQSRGNLAGLHNCCEGVICNSGCAQSTCKLGLSVIGAGGSIVRLVTLIFSLFCVQCCKLVFFFFFVLSAGDQFTMPGRLVPSWPRFLRFNQDTGVWTLTIGTQLGPSSLLGPNLGLPLHANLHTLRSCVPLHFCATLLGSPQKRTCFVQKLHRHVITRYKHVKSESRGTSVMN